MSEYELGPSIMPPVVQRELSSILRKRELIGTGVSSGLFSEFGVFQMRGDPSEIDRYVLKFWTHRLLSYDPNSYRLEKSNDKSLFIVRNALDSDQAKSIIDDFTIQDYDKFIIPGSDVRIVKRSLTGLCDVDEDGNLHYVEDQKAHSKRFISVPKGYVGRQVFLVVFDEVHFNQGGKERNYNPRDGVVIYKNPITQQRMLLPRLVQKS